MQHHFDPLMQSTIYKNINQCTIYGKIIARTEWPIKTKFGWPFLKLHPEVLYPGAVRSTSLLGGSGGMPPPQEIFTK